MSALLQGFYAVPPGVALALAWLLLLGALFHAFLRCHLRNRDRMAETEAQLACERNARAQAERSLGDTHAVLSKLVHQHDAVRETERSRIARDIHDDLGQNLLALKIELSMLQVSTSAAHPHVHQRLAGMIKNLDLTIKSLRAVINDLRPLALEAGLQSAMEWHLKEFSRINGIRHELEADPEAYRAGPDNGLDAMLYRVLQESLSNVVRHANATEVRIALRRKGDQLTFQVQDNGVGMRGGPGASGFGLLGIRDRVAAIGGRLVIDSAPGAGTSLSLSIPLGQSIAEQ
jgi:signal transduction histidine kinase